MGDGGLDTDTIESRTAVPRTGEPRPGEPARVYPAPDAADCWMVEAPAAASAAAPMLFSGPNAQKLALCYAYEAFGCARFFPF